MKIIASRCEIPGLNIPGKREILTTPFQHTRYSLSEDVKLPVWAGALCQNMLMENSISADEIGVIVNSSITVSGTTGEGNSAAPGLSNTVQRELNAVNAFVFDLFHTDWGTALEVGNMFLLRQQKRYGIVVKAEKYNDYDFDTNSGFSFPDGVSVLLFEAAENVQSYTKHFALQESALTAAHLNYITNHDIANTKMRFTIDWKCNETTIAILNQKLAQILISEKENSITDTIIAEKWFPPLKSDVIHEESISGFEEVYIGMHYIPWYLQQLMQTNKKRLDKIVNVISFNPFLIKYTLSTLSI